MANGSSVYDSLLLVSSVCQVLLTCDMDILRLVLSWKVECRSRVFILHKSKSGETNTREVIKKKPKKNWRAIPAIILSAQGRGTKENLPLSQRVPFSVVWRQGGNGQRVEFLQTLSALARDSVKNCNSTLTFVLAPAETRACRIAQEGIEQYLTKWSSY